MSGTTTPNSRNMLLRSWCFDALLCVSLLAVALLLTWPIVDMGINDDWSYTAVAFSFGHTGHLIYHGWASPIIGWQAVWGGVAARLFGFTYTVVRLSTWPVAFATVFLFHGILRRFDLNRNHAIFGTLTFGLSPLFLPLADTFMTDVASLFAIFVCVYMCQEALRATSDRNAARLLAAAGLVNIALGTVRQIAWLGVLVIVPCIAIILRRRKHVPAVGFAVWGVGFISVVATLQVFKHKPFFAPEHLLPKSIHLWALKRVASRTWKAILTTVFLCLPVLAGGFAGWGKLRRSLRLTLLLTVAGFLGASFWKPTRGWLIHRSPPWMENTLSRSGIMQSGNLFGQSRTIPDGWLLVALIVFLVSVLAFSVRIWTAPLRVGRNQLDLRVIATFLLPFVAIYGLMLFPRAAEFVIFDRYMLEVIAVLLVFLLRLHQDRLSPRMPASSYAVLTAFSLIAIAGTHDLFALDRARLQLFNEMRASGIPRTAIQGGFELDAMTQIDAWGYVNDSRIVEPVRAYHPQPQQVVPGQLPQCAYFFQEYVPVIHARYALETDDSPCVSGKPLAAVSYRTWLPIANRSVEASSMGSAPVDSKVLLALKNTNERDSRKQERQSLFQRTFSNVLNIRLVTPK